MAKAYLFSQKSHLQFLFVLLAAAWMGLLSCSKTEAPVPAKVQEIMKGTNCSCEPYIDLYRWKGQQLFVLKYKGSLCNWIPAYIREDGSYLAMPNGYSLMQFQEEGKFIRNIWTCGK